MQYINFIFSIILLSAIQSNQSSSKYHNEYFNDFQPYTNKVYHFKGQIIDTISEEKIFKLCSQCAMAIRFKVSDTSIKSDFIDLIVFNPNYEKMKLSKSKGIYSIKATTEYKSSKVLISPAGYHKDNVPIYWCDNITPDF